MAYGTARIGILGSGGFAANGVRFDGSTTYLSKASVLTSDASSKVMSFSCGVFKVGTGGDYQISAADGIGVQIFLDSSERVNITGTNNAGANILNGQTTTSISLNTWTHIGISVDMANTSNRVITFNGVAQSVTWSLYTDAALGFANASGHLIGAGSGGSSKMNGDLAELWENHGGTFTDFSDSVTYAKFVKNSKPANLGAIGQIPTGTSPIIYLSGTTADWHTNKGTGGGFTENGALTTSPTKPSY